MPSRPVSDEVWDRLAGEVSHVDEREARLLRAVVGGVAALLVAAVAIWALGVVSPRLDHGNASGATADELTHVAQYEFDVVNRGLLPVSVAGASLDAPGVVVTSTAPAALDVPGSSSRHLRINLRVSDCAVAVPAARTSYDTPLTLEVSRPWGTVATDVLPPLGAAWYTDLVLLACSEYSL